MNDTLSLTFPDGFEKLDEAQLQQLRAMKSSPDVCLRDEEKHIIVSLAYKRAGFLSGVLNGRYLIKSAQSRLAAAMRGYGYRLTGYEDRRVGSKAAQSFQYAYVAQDVGMRGECCAIKEGKAIYYLHFYVRETYAEEGFRLWKQVLADADWN